MTNATDLIDGRKTSQSNHRNIFYAKANFKNEANLQSRAFQWNIHQIVCILGVSPPALPCSMSFFCCEKYIYSLGNQVTGAWGLCSNFILPRLHAKRATQITAISTRTMIRHCTSCSASNKMMKKRRRTEFKSKKAYQAWFKHIYTQVCTSWLLINAFRSRFFRHRSPEEVWLSRVSPKTSKISLTGRIAWQALRAITSSCRT